jgi:hypothetical protein
MGPFGSERQNADHKPSRPGPGVNPAAFSFDDARISKENLELMRASIWGRDTPKRLAPVIGGRSVRTSSSRYTTNR